MEFVHEGEALKNAAKLSPMGVNGLAEALQMPRSTLYHNLNKETLDRDLKRRACELLGMTQELLFGGLYNTRPSDYKGLYDKSPGDMLRMKKAFGQQAADGLAFVPIFAQAGYSKSYLDPKYVDQLEQVKIPNMPFKGDRYRVFEVSDDSMEPTLKEHYHVVGETVEAEHWGSTAQFYIHVVVTDDRIMIKRLYRKSAEVYVLISDNEDFYPQFAMHRSEIKELWLVKRKMDWEMPPPKRFEISV